MAVLALFLLRVIDQYYTKNVLAKKSVEKDGIEFGMVSLPGMLSSLTYLRIDFRIQKAMVGATMIRSMAPTTAKITAIDEPESEKEQFRK